MLDGGYGRTAEWHSFWVPLEDKAFSLLLLIRGLPAGRLGPRVVWLWQPGLSPRRTSRFPESSSGKLFGRGGCSRPPSSWRLKPQRGAAQPGPNCFRSSNYRQALLPFSSGIEMHFQPERGWFPRFTHRSPRPAALSIHQLAQFRHELIRVCINNGTYPCRIQFCTTCNRSKWNWDPALLHTQEKHVPGAA